MQHVEEDILVVDLTSAGCAEQQDTPYRAELNSAN